MRGGEYTTPLSILHNDGVSVPGFKNLTPPSHTEETVSTNDLMNGTWTPYKFALSAEKVAELGVESNPKSNKTRRYRRFSKLFYGVEDKPKRRERLDEFTSPNSTEDFDGRVDAVDIADEMQVMISSALKVSGNTESTEEDITGFTGAYSRYYSEKDAKSTTQSRDVQLNSVFSPDATFRDRPVSEEEPEIEYASDSGKSQLERSKQTNQPCVVVHRASKLPEMLSGCNAYIVLDWGYLGKATTSHVGSCTDPVFKESFSFDTLQNLPSSDEEIEATYIPPLDVYVFHKNVSVSDEFIGRGHISEINMNDGVHIVHLFDGDKDEVGTVTLEIKYIDARLYI